MLEALRSEYNGKVEKYCSQIKDVKDLVAFCYKHNFSAEEYTEYEAAKAAKIRAKELLDLELE